MIRQTALATIILSVFLITGIVVPSQARDRDSKCEERVRKAEQKLNDEVRKHGERSKQAEQRRRDLERERAKCGGDERHDNRDRDHR